MTLKLWLDADESTRWIAILIGSERDAQHDMDEQRRLGEETLAVAKEEADSPT
jgi:hypothetical protein